MGSLAELGGLHTEGSRRLWEVCRYTYYGCTDYGHAACGRCAPTLTLASCGRCVCMCSRRGARSTVPLCLLWRHADCGSTHSLGVRAPT
eukprot:scaffold39775_cov54-Phaeocystis_antarctica.AAC.4